MVMAPGGNIGGDYPGYPQIISSPAPVGTVIDLNKEFTVFPNQSKDSSSGVLQALAALGNGPGTIYISVPGSYVLNQLVNVGDGSASQFSRKNGIYFAAPTVGYPVAGELFPTTTVEFISGPSFQGQAGPIMQINGVSGWGFQGIRFRANPAASVGEVLRVVGSRWGYNLYLGVMDCTIANLRTTAIVAIGGQGSPNCMKNYYYGLYSRIPNSAFARGVLWDGNGTNTTTNTWGEIYDHPLFEFSSSNTANTCYGIHARDCDSQVVRHSRFQFAGTNGAGNNVPLQLDFATGVGTNGWPTDCIFEVIDFGNTALSVVYNGSPSAAVRNVIWGVNLGNTRPPNPNLANLIWDPTMSARLLETTTALTNNAAAATATLTNAPVAGNPTKWIPVNDAGTIRNIPAW